MRASRSNAQWKRDRMEESEVLTKVIQTALSRAVEEQREFLTPEQLLLTALEERIVSGLFASMNCNVEKVKEELGAYIKKNVPILEKQDATTHNTPEISYALNEIYQAAQMQAAGAGKHTIDIFDIIVAIFMNTKLHASYILHKNGVQQVSLLETISTYRRFGSSDDDFFDSMDDDFMDDDDDDEDEDDFAFSSEEYLEKFTENMTEQAKKGEFNALIGREDEVERTIQILCRMTKNNPIHVGDAGVGKTAIAQGLAQLIARGEVPKKLQGYEIYSLLMADVLAGTRFRGDFEQRMTKIIQAIIEKEKAILYIDEIHTIVGTGASSGGNMDAANILKPLLSTGKFRVMGATTYEEYTKSIEKNHALSRRFQKIDVLEPSAQEAVKILHSLSKKYAAYHKVSYSQKDLELAVSLSIQYLPERRLPDKAIDIMDEAGVLVSLRAEKDAVEEHEAKSAPETDSGEEKAGAKPKVAESDIKEVTAKMAHVPLENIDEDEKSNLRELPKKLKEQIFGQDEAVEKLALAVKKARAGFRNLDKPEASFLFVGPTGVGKTELTRVLSSILGENLLRFDMSEYQESYSVSKLIGSAPGYVGYENGGLLTEQVRKNPHSIILFDEIEKAHQDIYNVLLQILDYGTLTDNQGRKADFRNCIIVMTSNAGARDMEKGTVGFASAGTKRASDGAILSEAVAKEFSPEFRNRLDAIVTFAHLEKSVTTNIARKAIEKIGQRLSAQKIKLSFLDDVCAFVAEKGYSLEFGARNISRTAEDLIATPLIDKILFEKIKRVTISVKSGELHIKTA